MARSLLHATGAGPPTTSIPRPTIARRREARSLLDESDCEQTENALANE